MAKPKKAKTPETPFERFAMLARKVVTAPKPAKEQPKSKP